MSDAAVKAAVLSTFGALAVFYCATLAVTANAFGSTIGAAFSERAFAASFLARAGGGIICALIVTFTLLGRSTFWAGSILAWVLLLGVTLILFRDTSQGEVSAAITAAAILVHFCGAVCAQRLVRPSNNRWRGP